MITLKSAHEIELMRRAGKITAAARALAGEMVKPGVTTHEIDKAVYRFIKSQGAEPSFLNYSGYPASVCVSVNDEIIHGIPGPRVLKEGDIVSVDVGAYIGGFHGDCAATYPCGKFPPRPSGSSTSHSRASSKASDSPARASAFRISLRRCRNTLRTMATASCANMSVTASAERCTRAPRCRTSARRATVRDCCAA